MSDDFKFGDLLRYRHDQDPDRTFLFMYVGRLGGYARVTFLQPPDDDIWHPGEVLSIGDEEMKLATAVLTHDGVREFQYPDGRVVPV